MTTTTAEPVEQVLLDGQAAAPPGPVDAIGMYLMHRGFRRDLGLFTAATIRTPVEDRACWARLGRRWALFADVLHKHHRGEDAGLWPLLRERGADPTVLDTLEAEHGQVDPLLEACAAGFARMVTAPDPAVRDELATRTAELRDALEAHLAREERDGMALVQAHLTPADWERLDREHFAAQYAPRDVVAAIGWVLHGLPADVARRVPGVGAALRLLGAVLAARFARADRRTFRYVP